MRTTLSLLLAVALLSTNCARTELVSRVVDGDTIELSSGEKVRYIGVDTPETVHPRKEVQFMGAQASAFNRELVLGKRVYLDYDVVRKDRYGRILAYVYAGRTFVNAELVRRGYAQVMTVPPNVKNADLFLALEREARRANLGLWDPEAAAEWNAEAEGKSGK